MGRKNTKKSSIAYYMNAGNIVPELKAPATIASASIIIAKSAASATAPATSAADDNSNN